MSWFRHRPAPKNPPVRAPKDVSPMTEKAMEETKKSGPIKEPIKKGS